MMNSLQFMRETQAFLTHLKPLMKERCHSEEPSDKQLLFLSQLPGH